MKIRLFTSGVHNQMDFSNEDIQEIYDKTGTGDDKVPFVLGHPKNDLPIVGWIQKKNIQLYSEGSKTSIGFERSNAEFSEESISVLKKLKQDKISVRLTDMAITHIGLVEKAAVKENNDQTFSAENKSGTFCFSEELTFENEEPWEDKFTKFINQFFNNKNQNFKDMNPNEKIEAENAALKVKVAEFEKNQTESAIEKENTALKAQIAEFATKAKESKKEALKTKVADSKLDENAKKEALEFGEKLLEKDEQLFDDWFSKLPTTKVEVKNGNVLGDKKDFAKKDEEVDINAHYGDKVNALLGK